MKKTQPQQEFEPHSAGEAVFAAIWLIVFIIVRATLVPWLDSIHPYAEFAFEIIFVLLSLLFFGDGRFKLKFYADKFAFALISLSLLLGTLTYKMAEWNGLKIPFALEDRETLVLLLLVGPILEELVYRQALWFTIEAMTDRWKRVVTWAPWILTSAFFSLGHLDAYSSVPEELKSYILYQGGYTLAIALWWGRVYQDTRSVGLTILLHMGFNFGFWLGSIA